MTIDLHTHSTRSDGTLPPADVLAAAAMAGLATIALTDHDTYAGWDDAAAAVAQTGVSLIRGIEISTAYDHTSIHLLAYLPDPDHAGLAAELERARESRRTRLDRMVAALNADGYDITTDDVRAQTAGDATTVGRPHLADALAAKGIVRDRDEAFGHLLHGRSRYYVGHYAIPTLRAIELVRAAGGVPVMAHPFADKRGRVVGADAIAAMVDTGLAGLEADHRDHSPEQRAYAYALARDLGVFVTGSSDFHGTGKLNELGENTTDPEVLERIVEQASGVPVIAA